MIEIPEAITLSGQIGELVAGRRISSAVANASPHGFAWYFGNPDDYPALLNGRTVDGARAVGGQIEIFLGDARILLNDGAMPRFLAKGEKRPKKHQLMLEFEDGSGLYCSIQMYGGIQAYPEGALDSGYYRVALEKPSPLSDAFTYEYFQGILDESEGKLSAKALLATEQRIPGLGNGVLQDILFHARVNPRRRIGTLSEDERRALYDSVRGTLREMTDKGGRDVERDLLGNPGGYATKLSRLTVSKPCPVCGGAIVKEPYLGGAVYYCPSCQPVAG